MLYRQYFVCFQLVNQIRSSVNTLINVYGKGSYVMVKFTVWMGQTRKNVHQQSNHVRKTTFIIIHKTITLLKQCHFMFGR